MFNDVGKRSLGQQAVMQIIAGGSAGNIAHQYGNFFIRAKVKLKTLCEVKHFLLFFFLCRQYINKNIFHLKFPIVNPN